MYWKYNNTSTSQIENLLVKEDVTLQEVMDEEDIINECRGQNKNLIEFLLKPEIIEELVNLTIKEPSVEIEERSRFKYPNIACELLTCDVPAINERLAGDKVILDKLYTFLECEPPLNPLLASYFSKIMGALIAKKTEQVLDFLKAKDTFISLLLKHLGTSAIMDLMLKLMTQVEGVEMRQNILNWLDSQRIMQSLVCLLNPSIDTDRHYFVTQLLCDFINVARDNHRNTLDRPDPDPLLNTLESSETVSLLLDNILAEEKSETAVVGGIQVLLTFLDGWVLSNSQYSIPSKFNSALSICDTVEKENEILNIAQAIKNRLTDFHNILLNPPLKTPILTTVGLLDPPVGNIRLQIIKLFACIISSTNDELLDEIIKLGTFQVLLDLFFKYPWNNFLHTQVENCLINALDRYACEDSEKTDVKYSNALNNHLFVECKLIERILDAWKDNDEKQAQEKGVRKGYMGHLINIVNKIVILCSNSLLGQYLKDNLPEVSKSLDEFRDTTLKEINATHDALLGGAHPSSSVDGDYGDIPFQTNALQQQVYSQYQMQHLTSQFTDNGFSDDAFNDGDDTFQTIDHRTDMNFDLSESDILQQQELFKRVCSQNINSFDDSDDQIFEEKEQTFQTVIEKQGEKEGYSSDSDGDGDDDMEVDAWSSSPKAGDTAKINPLDVHDPWDLADSSATTSSMNMATSGAGWADFSSVASFDAFSNVAKEQNLSAKVPTETDDLKLEDVIVENTMEVASSKSGEKASEAIVVEEETKRVGNIEEAAAAGGDHEKASASGGAEAIVAEKIEPSGAVEPSKSLQEIESSTGSTDGGSESV